MVIGIHTTPFSGISEKLNFLTINGIFRIAVPIFFVISGFYFPSISTSQKLKTWTIRIATLYIFWMLVYLPLYIPAYSAIPIDNNAPPFLITLLTGYWHLWYVAAMLLAGPILYLMKDVKAARLIPFALLLYFIGFLIQYDRAYFSPQLPFYLYRNFLFFALPMMMLGTAAAKIGVASMETRTLLCWLDGGLLLLTLEIGIAHHYAVAWGGFDMYLSLPIIASTVFLLTMKSKLYYQVQDLALLSSVLYFSHVLFMMLFIHWLGWPHGMKMFLGTLCASLIFYVGVARLPKRFRVVF